MAIIDSFLDGIDAFLAWLSASLKQTTESYCDLETADSQNVLAAHDGSLVSFIKIDGSKTLVGTQEFEKLHEGIALSLQSAMSRDGHAIQVFFHYDPQGVKDVINDIYAPAHVTAKKLN